MTNQYTPLDEIRPDQSAPTPRTDAFPAREIERAIHEALHPKGMSTHSGKVTLDASHVQRVLKVSRMLERELSRSREDCERLRKVLVKLKTAYITARSGREMTDEEISLAATVNHALAATRKEEGNG